MEKEIEYAAHTGTNIGFVILYQSFPKQSLFDIVNIIAGYLIIEHLNETQHVNINYLQLLVAISGFVLYFQLQKKNVLIKPILMNLFLISIMVSSYSTIQKIN
jgi:hypothetical protein